MPVIKIQPEYGTGPLWMKDSPTEPHSNLSTDKFNLSASLKERIDSWDKKYQNTLNHDYPPDSRFDSAQEEVIFEEEGLSIWKAMTNELSPEITIVYFSILNNKLFSPQDMR
jgi:hypothetical protein